MAQNLPSLVEYLDAVQNPNVHFADPSLKSATYASTALGQPLAETGGFALTFVATCGDGKKRAVRCFHKYSANIQGRYKSIAQEIKKLSPQYFVNFEFQDKGVLVNGGWYPVVKMDWATGDTLGIFLANNYTNGYYLTNLRKSLAELARYLESEGIAHGDISDGNLMISNDGRSIKLIDYDGMFVAPLANSNPAELGNPNFQHPQRDSSIWNNKIDRFSFILLDVVLEALINNPDLWNQTQSDSSSFLFRSCDFVNISQSDTYQKLQSIAGLQNTISKFASVCSDSLLGTPSLDVFQTSYRAKTVQSVSANLEPQSYRSAYPVVAARDYGAVNQLVGDKVELIGKIVEVKEGKTRYGRKYLFINFAPWKGKAVKISIWSDGLRKISNPPSSRDKGKWLSVIGLIEPPYSNARYGYTHLSITVKNEAEFSYISNEEAEYRLGGAHTPKVTHKQTPPRPVTQTSTVTRKPQTNKEKLAHINSLTQGASSSTPSPARSVKRTYSQPQQRAKTPQAPESPAKEAMSNFGCVFFIIGFVLAIILRNQFDGYFLLWLAFSFALTSIVGTCLVISLKKD